MSNEKLNPVQINILKILYNRKKRGTTLSEIQNILNTPELLEKELKLFEFNKNKGGK